MNVNYSGGDYIITPQYEEEYNDGIAYHDVAMYKSYIKEIVTKYGNYTNNHSAPGISVVIL